MHIFGIDIGATGGIGHILTDSNGDTLLVEGVLMPHNKTKGYPNYEQLFEYVLSKANDGKKVMFFIEGVHSYAGQGLVSTFNFAKNYGFVLGAVFVPNLWSFVEYLFPFALIGFAINGYFALKIFFDYFSRLIINGDFDFTKNNNLTQMISIFALSMVAVGFAAPGAMSSNIAVNAVGIFGAILFSSLAIMLIFIKIILGFKNMFEHGVTVETAPSLWIMIPILTLLGITFIRLNFGLEHNLNAISDKSSLFVLTSTILSLQIVFGILGLVIMKKLGYFEKFIKSNEKSALSFALICPGVAFFVFGMFFINLGLTYNEIITKYSVVYYLLMVPFIYVQIKTIVLFFRLYKKFSF